MKQRHSYTNLLYHLVFCTKQREHLFLDRNDEQAFLGFFKAKAHELDAFIEEFGCWRDHVHLLIRTRPTISLADVYGQLKGFSSYLWQKRFSDRPFKWADGVFAATVDPSKCDGLRNYIKNQKRHHENASIIHAWEPEQD